MRSWLDRYTKEPIAIILSVKDIKHVFDEQFYNGIEGGILEALGKLFAINSSVYVYPALVDGKLVTLETVTVPEKQSFLLKYLVHNQLLLPAIDYVESHLPVTSEETMKLISTGDSDWETCVPVKVAELIKKRGLYVS